MFGNSWTSQYGDGPDSVAGSEWGAAIAGIDRQGLDRGLHHFRMTGGQWPPSMGDFRAACLDIPSMLRVRREIVGNEKSPFARLVMCEMSMYDYRNADSDRADRMLSRAYEDVRKRVLLGEPLPEILPELCHVEQPIVPASPAVANAAMADIERSLAQ